MFAVPETGQLLPGQQQDITVTARAAFVMILRNAAMASYSASGHKTTRKVKCLEVVYRHPSLCGLRLTTAVFFDNDKEDRVLNDI